MYGITLIKNISKLSIRSIKPIFKKHLEKDVLLYKYEKPKFFLLINALSVVQGVFWSYLGYFLLKQMSNPEVYSKSPFWNWLYTKQMKYKDVMGYCAILFGVLMVFITLFYTHRSINYLTLNKGGKYLTIETYKVPGLENKFKVPLNQVSANYTRQDSKGYITLQIKNKWFYYIIDKRGEFNNPALFDCTAGIQRNFS
ncbi:conserved hypothetical protein [Pediculus humanus corporis]|uniref:Transmembrane protein 223 n=1 Tax=Pediculus humanus subsp. corporis TaxID=121224 RepID=E0VLR3_PEDHC|nr:uncharacterized protein Phum_PHUM292890 [Pediculus humanus corporis]EEB14319.1 conserved hypothetical protein [Pediculus humanus corporis]